MSVIQPPRFLVASSGPSWPYCLRASVGSTEASASLPARVGVVGLVVGPTRARS
jgi:hypothetical protein